MRVLVSALYCHPETGSEQGFGWWLVTSLARRHDVVVITGEAQRDAIEAALLDRGDLGRLRFVFVPTMTPMTSSGAGRRFERLAQYLWQIRTISTARRLAAEFDPDVAHHATSGSWRQFSCLSMLGTPLLLAPVAGSEQPPLGATRLVEGSRVAAAARRVLISTSRFDPFVRWTLQRASRIGVSGKATRTELQRRHGAKVVDATQYFPDPRLCIEAATARRYESGETLRLLWIGRLIPSKGVLVALRALSAATLPDWRLDVLGTGPQLERAQQLTRELGLEGRIHFGGHVGRDEVVTTMRSSHLLLCTSLQELMGQAYAECLQTGLGCVAFDWSGVADLLAGAGELVDPQPVSELIRRYADAIERAVEPERVAELSSLATARVSDLNSGRGPIGWFEDRYAELVEETRT